MMNAIRTIFIFLIIVIVFSISMGVAICSKTKITSKKLIECYKDSIEVKDDCIFKLNEDIIKYNIEVENYKDSINFLINELDSINEELQINKIKIERIREYNRIAAQGNNIKFLRGWINRVIN